MAFVDPCRCGLRPGKNCDGSCVPSACSLAEAQGRTVRLYRPEWVWKYSSTATGDEGRQEAEEHFRAKYTGRVRNDEWQVAEMPGLSGRYYLMLRLPNLKGEFKDHLAMSAFLASVSWPDCVAVLTGAREELELRDYGTKLLPATS